MRWTQLSDLGTAGRFFVSMFIGCAVAAVFVALALFGVTRFPPSAWSFAFAVPLMPGLVFVYSLQIPQNDTGGLGALFGFDAVLYGLVILGIWQRMIARQLRMKQ